MMGALTVPIPVTILGGYLGAGKTTLVNHLLRHADGRRIAVLVNEFGALSIDSDLIEARDGDLMTIAGGCICCSYGSDLLRALMEMAERGRDLDHILIEASGVALPGAIAQSLSLVAGVALDAVVVLADAETVRARADDRYMGDTITRQLADADLVVLNKVDLVAPADVAALVGWLADAAPSAAVLQATHGRVASEVMFGGARSSTRKPSLHLSPSHAIGRHDSADFDVAQAIDVEALAVALTDPSLNLVRAKGFVRARDGTMQTLQLVGRRVAITPAPPDVHAPPGLQSTGHIVCITHGHRLDRDRIAEIIRRCA